MGKIEESASGADMIIQCNMMTMVVLPLLPPEKGVVRIVQLQIIQSLREISCKTNYRVYSKGRRPRISATFRGI